MKLKQTKIKGVYIIKPDVKIDDRGYFFRVFCNKEIKENGIDFEIKQINRSFNKKKGTLHGMHFQKHPKAEGKIVQCIKGAIYDIALDLRPNSKTYGKWVGEELSEGNKKMLLIPKGCAHGYQSLKDNSEILYFSSEFYSPKYEGGIRWNDSFFKIKWPIKISNISDKDKIWPLIKRL